MYLKRLELQGYKSFARKTEFVFERGITAIVGPNGSGKSNIADGVRWVLGETRMSQLRAKTTDDLIFAGSDSRARLGMAQVSMTLDNSDGALPIDYTEVTVERRAYRDGQNEYLINGTKVRLRDIVELLGAGGLTRDAYAIIGQGLVDMALSLRPQERRALIDVAAGIRPLQDKRDRALAQLDETHANLTRVRDIAAEIAPRLRRLEKQAERAHQGAELARQLEEVLKTWYGYQWHAGQRALRDARARAAASRQTLGQRRQELATLEQQIESRRDREEAQADDLSDLREQRAGLRGRYEAVRRDLAVRQERTTLLQRRQQELAQEIADLRAERDEQQRQLIETETSLARLSEEGDRLAAQLEAIQRQQAGAQQRKAEYQSALQGARQEAFDLASTLTDLHGRLTALTERQEALTRERAAQQDAVTELVARIESRGAVLEDARRQIEAREQELQRRTRDREASQSSLQAATTRLDERRTQADDARRHLERLQARREALAELRTADDSDAAGARALLRAGHEISGVIGGLASLIRVPAEFETAIEAALGSNLHAVVVETWADAQRAIQWLQDNQAGRATLVVSGGVAEPGSRGAGERGSAGAEGPGVVGVASELVECEPRFKPLIRRLLGQTIVVGVIEAVHRVPPSSADVPPSSPGIPPSSPDVPPSSPDVPPSSSDVPPSSPLFVTLDGTVVHPSGYITGGSPQAPVLRRERLWRELPAQIQAAEAETRRLEEERAAAQMSVESLTRQRADLEAGLRKTEAAHIEARAAVEQARRDIEALERELLWRRSVLDQHDEELRTMQERTEELQGRLDHIRPRHADAESRAVALQTQLAELESGALRDDLAEAEKRLALAQRDRQNQQSRREDLRARLAGLERQTEARQRQIDALSAEIGDLQTHIAALAGDERHLAAGLATLEAEIAPAEGALRTMRREGRELERKTALARDLLRQAESAVAEMSLDVQRREDRLIALRDKIADDLELAALGEELPQQLTLALEGEGEVEVLPAVTEIPEGLERQVKQLRRQMRHLGPASPEIIAEYEETKARHDFLTSQAADLEEAAGDLRTVAAELTDIMQERFTATFDEVSRAFEKYFTRLFGGGEAHVRLVEEEESNSLTGSGRDSGRSDPGLEIVARPPGKRSQSLALLSGGERSLTAVALLFALLHASPTPFCVLDEVDAMLDEANIGRFRSALEELARETQFVIITHNRGTIQAANTIYGISMGDEGVSQAISLRLDELEPVAA